MQTFRDVILDLDEAAVLQLPVDNIGEQILADLNSTEDRQLMSRNNYINAFSQAPGTVQRVMMEGWMWLEREGAIAPDPVSDGRIFITRRGHEIASK